MNRGASARFTFGPGNSALPLWSPDGSQLIFSSDREGVYNLYRKPANGAREEEVLLRSNLNKWALSWSRDGKFLLGKRFSEIEKFRFMEPIGTARVVLAAQDEVATLPRLIPMHELDIKIGGNEIDRLRRWHKQGKLQRSRGMARQRFPQTPSPRTVARTPTR